MEQQAAPRSARSHYRRERVPCELMQEAEPVCGVKELALGPIMFEQVGPHSGSKNGRITRGRYHTQRYNCATATEGPYNSQRLT